MNSFLGNNTNKFTTRHIIFISLYLNPILPFLLQPKITFKLHESSLRHSILEFVKYVHVPRTNILHGHEFDCVPFHPSFFWTENFPSGVTTSFLWSFPLTFQAFLNYFMALMECTESNYELYSKYKNIISPVQRLTKLYNIVGFFFLQFYHGYIWHLVALLNC